MSQLELCEVSPLKGGHNGKLNLDNMPFSANSVLNLENIPVNI